MINLDTDHNPRPQRYLAPGRPGRHPSNCPRTHQRRRSLWASRPQRRCLYPRWTGPKGLDHGADTEPVWATMLGCVLLALLYGLLLVVV